MPLPGISALRAALPDLAWLPGQCRICHAWPAHTVCEACIAQFAQPQSRCRRCALPLPGGHDVCGACLRAPPPLDQCLAAVTYAYPWSGLIAQFKFRAEPGLVHVLTSLMRATPWVEPLIERADLLLPLPLSAQRLAERGYNQALLLARQLQRHKTSSTLLLRVKHTAAQHTLKRAQRLSILNDAYAIDPLLADQVRDRQLVLVDDVMTTGASLHACAHLLRRSGAAGVSAIVLARTEASAGAI